MLQEVTFSRTKVLSHSNCSESTVLFNQEVQSQNVSMLVSHNIEYSHQDSKTAISRDNCSFGSYTWLKLATRSISPGTPTEYHGKMA